MRDEDPRASGQPAAHDLVKKLPTHRGIHRRQRVVHQIHVRLKRQNNATRARERSRRNSGGEAGVGA